MSISKCIICDLDLTEDETLKTFKAGGIKTLTQSSLRRKDGKHKAVKKLSSITVHNACYVMYNRERSIASALKNIQSIPSSSRGSTDEQGFDFLQLCFFCAEDASDEFIKRQQKSKARYRKYVSFVSKPDTRMNILKFAKERNDKLGKTVSARLLGVENIVDKDARYHSACYKNFFNSCSDNSIAGRPVHSQQYEAVQFIIDYLLTHKEECQFSLSDILSNYEHTVPENRYLLRHLQEYFQSDILFHNLKKDTIITFRNTGKKILCDNWYKNRSTSEVEERERIVKTASRIVLEDIRSKLYDTTYNSAANYSLENVSDDIPKTLQIFLDTIVKKDKNESQNTKWDKRVNFYSHGLISSVRPRSFVSPLLLGLSSMMHKKSASIELIETLSYLGLCSSYQDTLLFEASSSNDPQEYNYDNSFEQFVHDNADDHSTD